MKKILIAFLLFLPSILYGQSIISKTGPVWAAQTRKASVTSGTFASVNLTNARLNSIIVVSVTWTGVPRPLSTTDTFNHPYTTVRARYDSTTLGRGLAVAYTRITTAGNSTVRVNFASTVTNVNLIVTEYIGIDPSIIVDTVAVRLTSSDPATTNALLVRYTGDLFVAAFTTNSAIVGPLDTFRLVDSARTLFVIDKVFRNYSQVAPRLDLPASARYIGIGVAFKRRPISQTDTSFVSVVWRKIPNIPTGYAFSQYWLSLHKDGRPLLWSSFAINDTVAYFRLPPPAAGQTSMYRMSIGTVVRSIDTTVPIADRNRVSKSQNILWLRTNGTAPAVPPDSVLPTISVRFSNSSTAPLVMGDSMEIFEKIFYYDTDTVGSSTLFKVATIYPRDTTVNFRWFVRGKKYKFYARTWYSGTTLTGDTLPLPALTVILGNRQ